MVFSHHPSYYFYHIKKNKIFNYETYEQQNQELLQTVITKAWEDETFNKS